MTSPANSKDSPCIFLLFKYNDTQISCIFEKKNQKTKTSFFLLMAFNFTKHQGRGFRGPKNRKTIIMTKNVPYISMNTSL